MGLGNTEDGSRSLAGGDFIAVTKMTPSQTKAMAPRSSGLTSALG